MISEIISLIWSTSTAAPRTVASMSMVERVSSPTMAATSIPPFKIKFSLNCESETRSRKRSIM